MYTTLIQASELAAHVGSPGWVIVDCRHDLMNLDAGRQGYALGHLPNAVFADTETELSGAKRGPDGVFRGRHPLPERDALIATLRAWGGRSRRPSWNSRGRSCACTAWWTWIAASR